jgi:hypothetical protein
MARRRFVSSFEQRSKENRGFENREIKATTFNLQIESFLISFAYRKTYGGVISFHGSITVFEVFFPFEVTFLQIDMFAQQRNSL